MPARVRVSTPLCCIQVLATLALVALVALAPATSAAGRSPAAHQADALYERLLAPCCWNQTLSIHESPLASQLRSEIAGRLIAGELPSAIEDDLARRYGERVRAVPRGRDPLEKMGLAVVCSLFAISAWLAHLGWRWTQRDRAQRFSPAHPEALSTAEARYEEALERELRRFDAHR